MLDLLLRSPLRLPLLPPSLARGLLHEALGRARQTGGAGGRLLDHKLFAEYATRERAVKLGLTAISFTRAGRRLAGSLTLSRRRTVSVELQVHTRPVADLQVSGVLRGELAFPRVDAAALWTQGTSAPAEAWLSRLAGCLTGAAEEKDGPSPRVLTRVHGFRIAPPSRLRGGWERSGSLGCFWIRRAARDLPAPLPGRVRELVATGKLGVHRHGVSLRAGYQLRARDVPLGSAQVLEALLPGTLRGRLEPAHLREVEARRPWEEVENLLGVRLEDGWS